MWCVTLVSHALPCECGHNCTIATSAVAKWFDHAWLQKFVNEFAPPTLQTFCSTSVWRIKGALDECCFKKVYPSKLSYWECVCFLSPMLNLLQCFMNGKLKSSCFNQNFLFLGLNCSEYENISNLYFFLLQCYDNSNRKYQ